MELPFRRKYRDGGMVIEMDVRTMVGKRKGRDLIVRSSSPLSNDRGRASTSIAGIVVFLLGIGLALFVIANPMEIGLFDKIRARIIPAGTGGSAAPAGGGEKEILYWYAPMDPTEIYDKPGLSKMGMKLLPKYAGEVEDTSATTVKIDPATVQNIGVLTEPVIRGDLKVEIRTVGTLDYNEQNVFLVNTKYDGWIEKVHVNYVGEQVRKGESLFEIYSPDLVSTQEEYLSALRYRDEMKGSGFPEALKRAEDLLAASRSRLLYWDITDKQIRELEDKGRTTKTLTVVSPVTGIVVQKMDQALEGMYAKAGMNLYKLADLSSLWVHVNIYEYQLPWIKEGQEAEVEISYYPGEIFTGKVLFFYPYLDEMTRTIRACIEIPNADGRLRPEMYATILFSPLAARDAVLVPEMAVLHSGERDVVVLALGDGRFEPRELKLGLQGSGKYQVLEGLDGDEEIVTSAQFLIDSESNLQEAIHKMLMAKKDESPAGEMAHGSSTKEMEHGSASKDMEPGSDTKHGDHDSHQMKSVVNAPHTVAALKEILEAYLPIWKALAGDSTAHVAENARKIAEIAGKAAGNASEEMLKKQLKAVEEAASSMKADDLKSARESMKRLSRGLLALFESHEVTLDSNYFIIYCPMVKERWIQDSEGVMNPFYGLSMLKCGVKAGEFGQK